MRIRDWSSDVCSSDLTSVMLLEVTDPVWPRGTSVPATRLEGAPQPPRQEGRPLERQAPGPCGRLRRTRRWLADQAEGVGAGASAPPDPRAEKTATRAAISSGVRSEAHTSELQSLMRHSYAGF